MKKKLRSLIFEVKEKKYMELMLQFLLKKQLFHYLDQIKLEAENTQSVNTIYLDEKQSNWS